MTNCRTSLSRRGFTLVELLVVMAIITVLGALVAAGVMGWMGGQARRNSETTIRQLYNMVMQHTEVIVNDAKNEQIPSAVMTFADGSGSRAQVIWIKIRLMEAFPVRFTEIQNAYNNAPLSYIPADKRRYMPNYKGRLASRVAANTQSKTESAACLYLALSLNRGGVGWNPDQLTNFTKDMDGDGMVEFVDGWDEPLYFYRFATGNPDLHATKPSGMPPPNFDPLDPNGWLRSWTGGFAPSFDTAVHPRLNGADAWYAVPLIASSGPNMKLGLSANATAPYADASVATASDADDNVYSYKIK